MQAHTSSPYQAYIGPTMKCWLGSFSLIFSVSISENSSNFFQRRNVSTQYRWYEWGRGKFHRSLRQSQAPSITLSLFSYASLPAFQRLSQSSFIHFSPGAIGEGSVWDTTGRNYSMSVLIYEPWNWQMPERRKSWLNSLALTLSSYFGCQARSFSLRVIGSIKSLTLPIIKQSQQQSGDWSSS